MALMRWSACPNCGWPVIVHERGTLGLPEWVANLTCARCGGAARWSPWRRLAEWLAFWRVPR